MFCRKCGEEVKEIDNFCGKSGKKQQQETVTQKKEVKTLSLDSYKHFKREERAGHFTQTVEKFNIDYYYQKKRTTHA